MHNAPTTIQNVAIPEGDAGTTEAIFTVTRTGSTAGTTTVDYATNQFSASSPQDYLDTSGTLTFAPGEASKSFAVTIVGDTQAEADTEIYSVVLTSPVNGLVLRDRATGAIIDDDFAMVVRRPMVMTHGPRGKNCWKQL